MVTNVFHTIYIQIVVFSHRLSKIHNFLMIVNFQLCHINDTSFICLHKKNVISIIETTHHDNMSPYKLALTLADTKSPCPTAVRQQR